MRKIEHPHTSQADAADAEVSSSTVNNSVRIKCEF